jgi:UDP-2,4-diacetamido-2,4,6-trideoxy-beta-L-altropyranose hydrolase
LIVDHYALDARWERALRPACRRLMVIDDLADRPHDCDLLLDQNLGRDAHDYVSRVPAACVVLVGPGFAMLRRAFAALRESSLARRLHPRLVKVLVSMGGVDRDNATGTVLAALRGCRLPDDACVTVVMGPHAPWIGNVREAAATLPWSTEVRVNVREMAPLMADSDLAIGAAGSTSWERCTLGLPTLMVVLADNQREAACALAKAGAVTSIDSPDEIADGLPRAVARLVADPALLRAMSEHAARVCDGMGAARVAGILATA